MATLDPFRAFIETIDDDRFPADEEEESSNHHLRESVLLFLRRYAHDHAGQGPTTVTVARQIGLPAEREGIALLLHDLQVDGQISKRDGGWYLRLGG